MTPKKKHKFNIEHVLSEIRILWLCIGILNMAFIYPLWKTYGWAYGIASVVVFALVSQFIGRHYERKIVTQYFLNQESILQDHNNE